MPVFVILKVDDLNQGQPEGSLFDSYNTDVYQPAHWPSE